MKTLVVFDLDGTLAQSKLSLTTDMASLLQSLLAILRVAIISGGGWPQFERQVLSTLSQSDRLYRLSILPTCGTQFFQYDGQWNRLYANDFTPVEKRKIIDALVASVHAAGLGAEPLWGDAIEDRGSQITYSALGQEAPLAEKLKWDADFKKRKSIKAILDSLIPEFSVRLGGTTSIDITKPGIDKAYGIRRLQEILHIPLQEMIFVGDALFPGGNDYPAMEAGVTCISVQNPLETSLVIQTIIACLSNNG